LKKGDLIYIPSEVTLYEKPSSCGPRDYKKTQEPTQALFLGKLDQRENYFKIFFEGQQWCIHERDILENR
jgi:hypothetical protein